MRGTVPRPAWHVSRTGNLLTSACLLVASLGGIGTAWGYLHTKGRLGIDWQGFFYAAAVNWQQGHVVYGGTGFWYPPPVLVLMRLFSLPGPRPSLYLWAAASVVMLLISTLITASVSGWRPSRRAWLFLLLGLLFSEPVIMLVVVLGQTSAWVLMGLAGGMWLTYRGRDGAAGAVLTLTLVKPQLAFLILPLLLYKRRWRSALIYLLVAAAATVISLLVMGTALFSDYLAMQRLLFSGMVSDGGLQIDVPGIHGLLVQWWPGSVVANRLGQVLSALVIAALAWVWRGPWIEDGRSFAVRWALLAVVTLFVSPYAHIYDMSLLVIPVVALAAAYFSPELTQCDRYMVAATLTALDLGPFLRMLFDQQFQIPGLVMALIALGRLNTLFAGRHGAVPADLDRPAPYSSAGEALPRPPDQGEIA